MSRKLPRQDQANRRPMWVRLTKAYCDVCNRTLDIYHDASRCREEWLKKLDAQGNPSNTRRKP